MSALFLSAFALTWLLLGFIAARFIFDGYPMDETNGAAVAALGIVFGGPCSFLAVVLFFTFCVIKFLIGRMWESISFLNRWGMALVKLADL